MRSFSPRREEPALAAALRSRPNWKKPASRWYKLPPRSRSPKWWVPTASSWARASCMSPAMLNCRPRRKKSCGENWCRKRWTRCNRMRSSDFRVGRDELRLSTIAFATHLSVRELLPPDYLGPNPTGSDYRRCIAGYDSKTLHCERYARSNCVAKVCPRKPGQFNVLTPRIYSFVVIVLNHCIIFGRGAPSCAPARIFGGPTHRSAPTRSVMTIIPWQ